METNEELKQEKNKINQEYRSSQEKYRYYLIGLSVAAIGYSVNLTLNKQLDYFQIPLAISIILWGWSMINGFRALKVERDGLVTHMLAAEMILGNRLANNHNEVKKEDIIRSAYRKGLDNISSKLVKHSRLQYKLFIMGIVFFTLWRVIEMWPK